MLQKLQGSSEYHEPNVPRAIVQLMLERPTLTQGRHLADWESWIFKAEHSAVYVNFANSIAD
jgi:hypothetical protein